MSNIFTAQKAINANLYTPVLEKEGLEITIANQDSQNNQALVRVNPLDALDSITKKITGIEDLESYLKARSEFLQMLKFCQKRLEKHDEKVFIDLMEKQQTDLTFHGMWKGEIGSRLVIANQSPI